MFDWKEVVGLSTPWRKVEYNWRDVVLYALAVGAGKDDLQYLYEKELKAVPSFVCTPYYSAVNNEPQQPLPFPANYMLSDLLGKRLGKSVPNALHAGFRTVMERPVDPIKGTLVHRAEVSRIYDRGSVEKGVAVEIDQNVFDEAGRRIAVNTSYHLFKGVDGSGLPAEKKMTLTYPETEPDYIVDSYISPVQNVLYRLTGDTNYVHIDPVLATKFAEKPFMQGLSSFGFACRMAIEAAIPGEDPDRMKSIYVQMRSVAFPDTPIQLRGWKTGETSMNFRIMNMRTGKAVLDNCTFEWA